MTWQDYLLSQCHKILYSGGEVKIHFHKRKGNGKEKVVPIIESYPSNQYICDEVEIEIED